MSLFNRFGRRRNGASGTRTESVRVKRQQVLGAACDRTAADFMAGMEALESRVLFVADPIIFYNFNSDTPGGLSINDQALADGAQNGVVGSSTVPTTPPSPDPYKPTIITSDASSPSPGSGGGTNPGAFMRFNGNRIYQGSGGRIETVPLNNILGNATTGASLSFFIRIPTSQAAGNDTIWGAPAVTGVEQSGGANDIFWGSQTAGGNIRVARGNGSTATTRATLADGNWHKITQTADPVSGRVRTYLDGRLESTATSETGVKNSFFSAIGALTTVNSDGSTIAGFNYLNADLDDVKIYNTELSLQDVGTLDTPNGTTSATLNQGAFTATAGLSSATLSFQGVTNAVTYTIRRATVTSGVTGTFADIATLPGDSGTINYTNTGLSANTTYTYRIVATNGAGESAPIEQTVSTAPPTASSGLSAFYYNTAFWGVNSPRPVASSINLSSNVAVIDPNAQANINFDYGNGSPATGINADNFGTVFVGKLLTPTSNNGASGNGVYTILAFSDDESFVFVNGQLTSGDEGGHGIPANDAGGIASIETNRPITLQGGTEYNFMAMQGDTGGGAGIILRWKRPGDTAFSVIPPFPGGGVSFQGFTTNIPDANPSFGGQPAGALTGGLPAPASNISVTRGASDLGSSYAILNWNDDATNEIRYEVVVNGPGKTNETTTLPINANQLVITGLTASSAYTVSIRAINYFGTTTASLFNFNTLATNPPPQAVSNLVARSLAKVQLTFTDNSLTESQFIVQRKLATDPDTAYATIPTIGTVTSSSTTTTGTRVQFSDTSLVAANAGTRYTYRVYANNATGLSTTAPTATITYNPPAGTGFTSYNYNSSAFANNPVIINNVGTDVNFGNNSPGSGVNVDNFTINLEGEFTAEFSEPYTFRTTSDDGVALRIVDKDTGAVLVDYDNLTVSRGLAATGTFSDTAGTATLVAGKRYLIQGRQREGNGGAGYRFGWISPSIKEEVIPRELIFNPSTPLTKAQAVTSLLNSARTQATISFADRSLGETGFQIFRSTSPTSFTGSPLTTIQSTVGVSPNTATVGSIGVQTTGRTTFVDTGIGSQPDGIYYYMVRVLGPGGATSDSAPYAIIKRPPNAAENGLTFNGNASVLAGADGNFDQTADNIGQLTPANTSNAAGSIFTANPRPITVASGADQTFTASFDFSVPAKSTVAGEGFAFVIQAAGPNALGGNGRGLGYSGIANSLALKFDFNGGGPGIESPPGGLNSINLYSRGTIDASDTATPVNFPNGTLYHVDVAFLDPGSNSDPAANSLTATIKDQSGNVLYTQQFFTAQYFNGASQTTEPNLDLTRSVLLGGNNAYVGFTGSTSGNTAQIQIRNFNFNGSNIPLTFNTPTGVTVNPSNSSGVLYDRTTQTLIMNPGAGTVTMNTDLGSTLSPRLNVVGLGSGNNVVFNSTQHLGSLTLIGGATATVTSVGTSRSHTNHRVLVVDALSIDQSAGSTSKLDLTDNDLVVHGATAAAGTANETAIRNLLIAGRNVPVGGVADGKWNGTNGIVSATAAALDGTGTGGTGIETTILGYALVSTLPLGIPPTFLPGGEVVGSNDVVVKYTYNSDYSLDGQTADDDVTIVGAFFNRTATGQPLANGDSNFNGKVDDDDVTLLGAFFNYGKPTNTTFKQL